MKKITTKVLTIVAACAAMVFASCAQPSTSGNSGNGGNGGNSGSVTVWEGNTVFENWKKTSGEDINISKDVITDDTIGLKITWSASASEGITLKMQDMNWGSNSNMKFKKSDADDFAEQSYLWATSTTTDFTFDAASLATVKQYGVQVYGDKITITKVELLKGSN